MAAVATKPATDDRLEKAEKSLESLNKKFDAVVDKLSKTVAPGTPDPKRVLGSPHIREGEDPMTSRGFSFMKMLGLIRGAYPREQAKVETSINERMYKMFVQDPMGQGAHYENAGAGQQGQPGGWFLAPLATAYLPPDMIANDVRAEFKSLVLEGVKGADPDEMGWISRKTKALSWINETTGGSLVAPPEMGELIELLRNKEALVNAGARVVPLPPQGRMKYPKQTLASNTYWVGESSPITDSNLGTGEITLQAKKLAVLIKAPNELLRFASPAAEALMRDDMTKSLALGLDLAGLEGAGTDLRPKGVIQYQSINRITSSSPGANGDKLVAQDVYRMIAAVEESNAEFESFIMRPKMLLKFFQLRSDAVGQGDAAGPFLFSLIRDMKSGIDANLAGYPVVKSTQVSQVRSKGTASNLSYILGGMFSDVLIGMFGAIEFAATTMGDTSFVNDQTWVRGILSADIQIRHEAALVLLDNLDSTL